MSYSSDCPFYAGATISDPRFFVGRHESLQILRDRLTATQPTSINIVGRHRTGKSSLLLHFVNTYRQRVSNPDRFAVVYLSLQNAACDTQTKFYGRIAQLLAANIPWNQWRLQRMLAAKEWEQVKFNELIQEFKNQGILPVLCIDNFEELLDRQEQFPNGFYDNLRYLVSNNYLVAGGVAFVVAGGVAVGVGFGVVGDVAYDVAGGVAFVVAVGVAGGVA